jgi:hypothetical protein
MRALRSRRVIALITAALTVVLGLGLAASPAAATSSLAISPSGPSPVELPYAHNLALYPPVALSASGGTAPYTFAVTAGALPVGLTLSPSGIISGTPTIDLTKTFTVTVTDSLGALAAQQYLLPVGGISNVILGASTVALNGTTSITFNILNTSGSTETSGAFSEALPAGVVVATPNGLSSTCTGTPAIATAVAGSSTISLTGAVYALSGVCHVTVNITGTTTGIKNFPDVAFTSSGPQTTANVDSLTVTGPLPPTISDPFGAASIFAGGTTTLSFTVTNPNGTTLTGIGFTDTLPTFMTVRIPNGLTGSCGGGTITAVAGSGSVSLSGATLAGSASCTFSVNITSIMVGSVTNTTSAVTSTEGGTGLTASASLLVNLLILIPMPPGAPTVGAATATGNGTATVAYTAPESNGGSAIVHYDVTSMPVGATGTFVGSGSGTIVVSGLVDGISYTFTVTATNISGTSPPSGSSNPVTNGTATPAPTVTSISPTSGPIGGGTVVTVTGRDFAGVRAINFGPAAGTSLLCPTAIVCTVTAPTGTGTVNITVVAAGGTSAVIPAGTFTYNAAPLPDREAGADRIATAVAVSVAEYPVAHSASAVILARADNFPDALAGVPLAVARKAPVLLTPTPALDPATQAEIARVLPAGGTVYLLGGTEALSAALETSVGALGYTTIRYTGANRFATAVAVATGLGSPATVLLTDGTGFPDALSAGAAAAKVSGAVLLSDGSTMAPETAAYLAAHPASFVQALGGPAATADPTAPSIVGADRYATSALVAAHYFTAPQTVGVASGVAFPDALAGGVQVGMLGGPLLLTDPNTLSADVAAYLHIQSPHLANVFVYGGSTALSDAVVAAIHSA